MTDGLRSNSNNRRLVPKESAKRELYFFSGNQCMFEACRCVLQDPDDGWIGEIAHIEAVGSNGPRANENLTPEQLRCPDNLMLLCANHHRVVDNDPETYTVEKLRKMKASHIEWYLEGLEAMSSVLLEDETDNAVITIPDGPLSFFSMADDDQAEIEEIRDKVRACGNVLKRLNSKSRQLLFHLIRRSELDRDEGLVFSLSDVSHALIFRGGHRLRESELRDTVHELRRVGLVDNLLDPSSSIGGTCLRVVEIDDELGIFENIYNIALAKSDDDFPDIVTLQNVICDLNFGVFAENPTEAASSQLG